MACRRGCAAGSREDTQADHPSRPTSPQTLRGRPTCFLWLVHPRSRCTSLSMIMADFVFLSTSSKKGLVMASAKMYQSLHAFSEKLKALDSVPNKNSWIKMIK